MKNENAYLIIIIPFLLLEFLLLWDTPAFWDAKSKFLRASWIYENSFKELVVPTDINSGHPPLWILLIALFWKLFGKFIWSARLLLLIVNVGVFFQILKLGKSTLEKTVPFFAIFLVFIEPTLVAQTTILNNDMLLLFFTLLALNSLLDRKWIWYSLALCGLLFSNLRGIYCFIALMLIHYLVYKKELIAFDKGLRKSYILPLLLFIGFLIYQYNHLGWVIITPNKGFASQREPVGLFSSLKNTVIYVKNFLDLGRLFLWMAISVLLWKSNAVHKIFSSSENRLLLISFFSFCGVFFVGMVPFSNPIGARYFLICYILSVLIFLNLIYKRTLIKKKFRRVSILIVALGFITGHLWIYPSKIAQSWDSSLAYLNYFPVEEKMITYIQNHAIKPSVVGTNLYTGTYWISRAKETLNSSVSFKDIDLAENQFIIFSNIENISSDELIDTLQSQWHLVKKYEQLGVFMSLYQNPNSFLRKQ